MRWLALPSWGRLWDVTRSRFWILPSLCVIAAIGAGIAFVSLDHAIGKFQDAFLYPGPAGGARTFLQAIVEAMITVTGTVFSVSVVAIQLANGQFSSRIIPVYLRDLTVQSTLGLFMATFVYSMVVLRSVGSSGQADFVPRVAVTVAFVLVVASVGMFIAYISRISGMLRVASIVRRVAEESERLMGRRYPVGTPPSGPDLELPLELRPIPARRAGVVVSVNEKLLAALAGRQRAVLVMRLRVGDFVAAGAPLFTVYADAGSPLRSGEAWRNFEPAVLRAVSQDIERTMEQDLAFGVRQLVDIAEKALSPSLNDPTTAVQCVDVLHDILRQLAGRHLPDGRHVGDDHQVRLVIPQYSFADLLDVALAEIWRYGQDAAQVPERIARLLDDLSGVALREHRPAIEAWQRIVRPELPAPPPAGRGR